MVPSMTGTQAPFQPSSMLGEPKTVSPEKGLLLTTGTLC